MKVKNSFLNVVAPVCRQAGNFIGLIFFVFIPFSVSAITYEEIMNKVKQQRELLQDMQANLTTKTTRLNKTTEAKSKYYYKNPDKTRTETNEKIIIRDGSKLVIKNLQTNEIKTIEPPKTSLSNTTTYKSTDLYDTKVADQGNSVYKIEMAPKATTKFITKTEMVVDYAKGITLKTTRYDSKGKVTMQIENMDYRLFNGNIWIAMKTVSTTKFPQHSFEPTEIVEQSSRLSDQPITSSEPKFPEFTITTETEYTDVKVNIGLDSSMFKF